MSSIYHLLTDTTRIEDDIVKSYEDFAAKRYVTHFAAISIQKTFRGYATRKTIHHWNEAAITIQRVFRGWLVRYKLPEIVHEHFDKMCLKLYMNAATIIQARWRGYRVRKFEVSFPEMMRNKNKAIEANEKMGVVIRECRNEDRKSCLNDCTQVLNLLFERNHLLRTRQKEGVFSVHESNEYSQIEQILKDIHWTNYMKRVKRIYEENHHSEAEKPQEKHFLQNIKEVFEPNQNIHKKPFLVKKIEDKPYDKMLIKSSHSGPRKQREKIPKEQDFNLSVYHLKKPQEKQYHIDFWYKHCNLHNI